MAEALFRAVCVIVLLVAIHLAPGPAIVGLGALILGWAFAANKTHAHPIAKSSIVITGASSGLGRAIAIEAARRGASKVFLLARTVAKLEDTAAQIRAEFPWCAPVVLPCDVTDPEACRATHAKILDDHGLPDILVNNAGAGAWHHIEEGDAETAVAHMACPYFGAVQLTQLFVPGFAARGSGHVLNVTSLASLGGYRAAVTYGTARWAIRGFSQYLRADVADLGIGVTLLNAAEITGTSYFDNAPGKAGAESHARLPTLFQLPVVTAFSGDTRSTAKDALNGVEGGTHEVLSPALLTVPAKLFADLFPEAMHHALRFGPNGRRSTP